MKGLTLREAREKQRGVVGASEALQEALYETGQRGRYMLYRQTSSIQVFCP
jgi:hypothetical protein